MKLEKFKEKDNKKKITIGICIVLVLLVAGIIAYKSFAFYEERKAFDVIKGQVPDQNYDLMFSFYIKDENGNHIYQENMPEGKDYSVSVTCTNGATGVWDYEVWGPVITNLTNTRTKCKLIFGPPKPLRNYGIESAQVTIGDGLYEVTHDDAEITYTSDEAAINNLKQTEYRYAGKNPNNYVTFNGEEAGWRMIGLVNTPEGQRIKLVRASSIGNYSWDSSDSSVNSGYGVNEWSQAAAMNLLNNGPYYNRTSGTCYNGRENSTTSCDFSVNGLTNEAKEMIDTVTWNTGANGSASTSDWQTANMYNYERSNNTGKDLCSSKGNCSDTVTRTTKWTGKVGLMYPSDYGYTTSGGATSNRDTCLSTSLVSWKDYSDCYGNAWLSNISHPWFMTPVAKVSSCWSFFLGRNQLSTSNDFEIAPIIPTIYLKSSVTATSGDGTSGNPYVLS